MWSAVCISILVYLAVFGLLDLDLDLLFGFEAGLAAALRVGGALVGAGGTLTGGSGAGILGWLGRGARLVGPPGTGAGPGG